MGFVVVIPFLLMLSDAFKAAELPPASALQVEQSSLPYGLDEPLPRFSWHIPIDSVARGTRQAGYRIIVCLTAPSTGRNAPALAFAKIAPANIDLITVVWDSGWISISQSFGQAYGGTALVSNR